MLVKIMSDDGLPDGDYHKGFQLVADVVEIEFSRKPMLISTPSGTIDLPGPTMTLRATSGQRMPQHLPGNVYILDEFGKTIDRFIVDAPRPPAPPQPRDPGPRYI